MNALILTQKDNYLIIEMNQGKVNAIEHNLASDLQQAFTDANNNPDVKGVILTGRPHCFSAGLDVAFLATATIEELKDFWRAYMGALRAMVLLEKPFVAALTGYAPAGATIFALCADYRIMGKGEKHKIGMNEFNMSLQIPQMLSDVYAVQLGERMAWKTVQQAALFNSDEALEIGLVDESLEVEEVFPRAEKYLKRLMNVYLPVYKKTKRNLTKKLREVVNQDIEALVEEIAEDAQDPRAKQMAQMFAATLKK